MRKILLALSFLAMVCVADLLGQGPLTNALNLRVRTDANGSLVATGAAYTAPDGPLTALGNIRLRTDANGYLITTSSPTGTANFGYFADGSSTTPSIAFSSQVGLGLYRSAASVITLTDGTTKYVSFPVASGIVLASNRGFQWASTGDATGAVDTQITRGGAGEISIGGTPVTFATLGTPGNGAISYCSDCTPVTPATCPATKASCVCAASGTGALAVRINSVWDCGTFQ